MLTAEMSSNIGECHLRDAVFICHDVSQYVDHFVNTYRVDEGNASKVNVIMRIFFNDLRIMYRFRSDILVAYSRFSGQNENDSVITHRTTELTQTRTAKNDSRPIPKHHGTQQAQASM